MPAADPIVVRRAETRDADALQAVFAAAAVAFYGQFGFEIEGTARGYALRDGVPVDAFMMTRRVPRPAAGDAVTG